MRKVDAVEWLNKIINCPENYRMYYSDQEQIELAQIILNLLSEMRPYQNENNFYCSNCNGRIESYHEYCPYCGKEVKWD